MKVKDYKIWVKNAMCDGAESWAMEVEDIKKLEITKVSESEKN